MGPHRRWGGACAVRAFCRRQNLGAGAIHLPRACEIISRGSPAKSGFRGGLTSSWTSSILCVLRKRRTRRSKHPLSPCLGATGPHRRWGRRLRRTSVFANGENLGAGAIHLPRACEIISRGPHEIPDFVGISQAAGGTEHRVHQEGGGRGGVTAFSQTGKRMWKTRRSRQDSAGFLHLSTPHEPSTTSARVFRRHGTGGARRARPVQRSCYQGLRGNPDACRPKRGSACDVSEHGAPAEAQRSGFGGERRHSGRSELCRLRRSE